MREPASMSAKNQTHDTMMQLAVNNTSSEPLYCKELVPMTPIISTNADGFKKDTEQANKICFLIGKAVPSISPLGAERQIDTLI